MALFQKNGVQLNTAILDLSKSFDANSLCNFEETNQSLHVFGKGGTTICNHVPGVPLNILEAYLRLCVGLFTFSSQSALSSLLFCFSDLGICE